MNANSEKNLHGTPLNDEAMADAAGGAAIEIGGGVIYIGHWACANCGAASQIERINVKQMEGNCPICGALVQISYDD